MPERSESKALQFVPYEERVATVVGGRGQLGSKITAAYESVGFGKVEVCEKQDPFLDFVNLSTDLFFAVDNIEIERLLQAARDYLRPEQTVMDGSSVKAPLITLYRELDDLRISIASTHLGSIPTHPWRGVKVWVCEVGPNSNRAKRLAFDLFLSTNSSIQSIDIREHQNVERDQWITMATAHIVAAALRKSGYSLSDFDKFATLNAELLALPIGRTLGQGSRIPSEVLFNQPKKQEFLADLLRGVEELRSVLEDRGELEELIETNIGFHDNPSSFIGGIFRKAGVIGARNANLRMCHFSFRITNDRSGRLRTLLEPFAAEGANLTAIDSMPGVITDEERAQGVDPDRIVDFDVGIDPKTINSDKDRRIKERLVELGCTITDNNHLGVEPL